MAFVGLGIGGAALAVAASQSALIDGGTTSGTASDSGSTDTSTTATDTTATDTVATDTTATDNTGTDTTATDTTDTTATETAATTDTVDGSTPPTAPLVPRPANDDLAAAATLAGMNGSVSGSTEGATSEGGEPNAGASIWWRWTAPAIGRATFSLDSSGPDIRVYSGPSDDPAFGELEPVRTHSGRDAGTVTFTAREGTTYYVQVVSDGATQLWRFFGLRQLAAAASDTDTVALDWTLAASAAATGSPADATALAQAIAANASVVTGASYVSVPSGQSTAVESTSLAGFPTRGSTFGVLSSGDATTVGAPGTFASTDLGGGNVRGDSDLDVTILKIDLAVPTGANCLSFDFRFLSEEYPDFVGSDVNDAFVAELDESTWTTQGSTISAPNNFAFDPNGDVVSVNSSGATSMSAANGAGTAFDGSDGNADGGATPLLHASKAVTSGAHSLYLSIFDQGDNILDSAVFVDNLVFGTASGGACQSGATVVSLTKTADEASVTAGGADGYTITAHNDSASPVTLTAISDTLPDGFSYTDGSTTIGGDAAADPTIDGQTLTWSGSFTVLAGGTLSLHFGVKASTTPGDYDNNASATGSVPVSPTGPTASVTVTPAPEQAFDLGVGMEVSPTSIDAGGQATFTATVENLGPGASDDPIHFDWRISSVSSNVFPELVSWSSNGAPGSGFEQACTENTTLPNHVVTCNFAPLEQGATITFTAVVQAGASDLSQDIDAQARLSNQNDTSASNDTATALLTVAAPNAAPTAADDSYDATAGQQLSVSAAEGVLANDSDPNDDALTAVLSDGPLHAESFQLNADGSFTYTPAAGFTGTDGFSYRASDGSLESDAVADVTITVVENSAPTAADDAYDATAGEQLLVSGGTGVLANDSDPEEDTLNAVLESGPAHATSFSLHADGSFTYTAAADFTGDDSFTYRASDGSLESGPATVTIHVQAIEHFPSSGAVADLTGCSANTLPANDDDSTGLVQLPFTLNFFGQSFGSAYVNNNGNITFTEDLSSFTPDPIVANGIPIIAPFWADVDTEGAGSGVVQYGNTTFQGHSTFCVIWPRVGYYSEHTDRLNDFQLLLVDRSDTGAGNFDIYFNYNNVEWETGDASDGEGGLGGDSARIGYSNGSTAAFELPGSAVNGAFLDSNQNGLIYGSRDSAQLGRYVFRVRSGVAETGRSISGSVLNGDNDNVAVADADVSACAIVNGAADCHTSRTGANGNYTISGLPAGTWIVRATPPVGSQLLAATKTVVLTSDSDATGQNIVLHSIAPDLRMTVDVTPATAQVGTQVTFTYQLSNEGNADATNVAFGAGVPDGTTIVETTFNRSLPPQIVRRRLAAIAEPCTASQVGTGITCFLGTVVPGETDTVTMIVTAATSGALTSTATFASNEAAANPGSATATIGGGSSGGGGGTGGSGGTTGGGPAGGGTTTTTTTTTTPPPSTPPTNLPAPSPGNASAAPVTGTILVNGQPFTGVGQIPDGATIDATNGIVQITIIGPNGELQSAFFFGGIFVLHLFPGGAELQLAGGDFSVCTAGGKGRHLAAKPPKKTKPAKKKAKPTKKVATNKTVVRSLWGEGTGNFRTRGRFSAATVRGTFWLTADRCDGTLTRVEDGTVSVEDFVRRKTVIVAAGHSYLALAPGLKPKRR